MKISKKIVNLFLDFRSGFSVMSEENWNWSSHPSNRNRKHKTEVRQGNLKKKNKKQENICNARFSSETDPTRMVKDS